MVKKLETTASTYSAYLRGTIFPLQKHFLKGKYNFPSMRIISKNFKYLFPYVYANCYPVETITGGTFKGKLTV